ncbi:unnamed protein product [Closterium sp. NIES-53]
MSVHSIKEKQEVTISHNITQFLGLNITQSADTIHLSAAKYADSFAKKFGIAPINLTNTFRNPLPNHEPDTLALSAADHHHYQQQLGCLLSAAITCRPDLSYAASHLAQYLLTGSAAKQAAGATDSRATGATGSRATSVTVSQATGAAGFTTSIPRTTSPISPNLPVTPLSIPTATPSTPTRPPPPPPLPHSGMCSSGRERRRGGSSSLTPATSIPSPPLLHPQLRDGGEGGAGGLVLQIPSPPLLHPQQGDGGEGGAGGPSAADPFLSPP